MTRIGIGALYIIIAITLFSCASSGSLSGGAKDEAPPVMDTLRSAKERQTNFRPRELDFYFDEFVEVKDAIRQVLVSPPLTYIPKVVHRGKKVTFAFDEKEVLRENATYSINFGEAVVDYHESNKLQNFVFVFATGPYIDSLSIKGKVTDSKTGEGEGEMVVLLYDNLADSAIYREKPFYFAKPLKSGEFTFSNIKNDTFRIIAIKDENLNYRYDPGVEKLAFSDSLIILDAGFRSEVQLLSSLPSPKPGIQATNSRTYGKVNVLCTSAPDIHTGYTLSEADITSYREIAGDSVNIYYDTPRDSFYLYIMGDTVKVKPKGKADLLKKNRFRRNFTAGSVPVLPADSLVVAFNFPLAGIPSGGFYIADTIGVLEDVKLTLSNDHKKLIARYEWLPGEQYQITIDSGAISSIYGQANDSIGQAFTILTADKTGNLNLTVRDLDTSQTYLVNILKNNVRIAEQTVTGSDSLSLVLKGLVPDKYDVEVITDRNMNGKWDPGNYETKSQPEQYRFFKGDRLRENRNTDMVVSLKSAPAVANEPKNPLRGLQQNKGRQ